MKKSLTVAGAAMAAWLVPAVSDTGMAYAQECIVEAPDAYEMTDEHVAALYECIGESMVLGYTGADHPVAAVYRDWAVSGTRHGPDATHGNRLLLTFANELAAPVYLEFAEEDVSMPVGAILAKESISVKKGKGKVGPLFIMEKVGTDSAPETMGWLYSAVKPNGKPMKIKQSFCHDCHVAYEDQDALAYPAEEYRVSVAQ